MSLAGAILTEEEAAGSEFFLILGGEAVCTVRRHYDSGSKDG